MSTLDPHIIDRLVRAEHGDPFSVLGPAVAGDTTTITTLLPGTDAVTVVAGDGKRYALARIHDVGLFSANLPAPALDDYTLEAEVAGRLTTLDDPYRFPPTLGNDDVWHFAEGRHHHAWRFLGADETSIDGVSGVRFAVWAPNAARVAVVGDFNAWDARTHGMRFHPGSGIWEMFVPGPRAGALYRFEVLTRGGDRLVKADPYARAMVSPADTVAVVTVTHHEWQDAAFLAARNGSAPLSVYEVHAGSWRHPDHGDVSWPWLAEHLVPYVRNLGFTHIEFLPISEHPFGGSWGYQPIGLFAPTARFGSPDDFRAFVDAAHAAGLGIILDWVPAHFPKDPHGLVQFDGTALYEHEDPRRGEHPDWGTLIFNYDRAEVRTYLVSSALYWIEEFHIDGLRVDAVASMLYLDYSRKEGEWLPNAAGGRENLGAIEALRQINAVLDERHPQVLRIAEESTAWPGVTRSPREGGLGFSHKWNMGWMHDTRGYFALDPIHRRHHHDQMTFSLVYAFSERFVLPLSHDEVVHGKGSLLGRMPGDRWQQLANLRALLAFMWAHPGGKHLFMGGEFGQDTEWNHDDQLPWDLLASTAHGGVQQLLADLNRTYRSMPALNERDDDPGSFEWLIADDADNSVFAFLRHAGTPESAVLVVANLTPVVRDPYVVSGVPTGTWHEIINTDSAHYHGSNVGALGPATTGIGRDGSSLALTLPPLGVVYLRRDAS